MHRPEPALVPGEFAQRDYFQFNLEFKLRLFFNDRMAFLTTFR